MKRALHETNDENVLYISRSFVYINVRGDDVAKPTMTTWVIIDHGAMGKDRPE